MYGVVVLIGKCRVCPAMHGCLWSASPVGDGLGTPNEKVCICTLVQDLPLPGVPGWVAMLIKLRARTDRFLVGLRCMCFMSVMFARTDSL